MNGPLLRQEDESPKSCDGDTVLGEGEGQFSQDLDALLRVMVDKEESSAIRTNLFLGLNLDRFSPSVNNQTGEVTVFWKSSLDLCIDIGLWGGRLLSRVILENVQREENFHNVSNSLGYYSGVAC